MFNIIITTPAKNLLWFKYITCSCKNENIPDDDATSPPVIFGDALFEGGEGTDTFCCFFPIEICYYNKGRLLLCPTKCFLENIHIFRRLFCQFIDVQANLSLFWIIHATYAWCKVLFNRNITKISDYQYHQYKRGQYILVFTIHYSYIDKIFYYNRKNIVSLLHPRLDLSIYHISVLD